MRKSECQDRADEYANLLREDGDLQNFTHFFINPFGASEFMIWQSGGGG